MAAKKGTVPFSGTKEQEEALTKVIDELRDEKGALMPILQKAQDIYGYLPYEVQKMISDQTGIPLEKIYGVTTFYSQFTLNPKGRYRISVCLGNWGLRADSARRTESSRWMRADAWEPADSHRS